MADVLIYEVASSVATITFNRPEALNALDESLSEAAIKALDQAATDLAVRCVLITGAGRAFCSGADLQEAKRRIAEGGSLRPSEILRRRYNPIILAIVNMEKPVVAAVNGVAAGAGASVALACDYRVASEQARFMQAFIKIGLVPDAGANYFLPRFVGYAKALELAMSGDIVDAQSALELGLVNKVVPHEKLMDEANALSQRFAEGPTKAYGLTKKTMRFGSTYDLEAVLEFEPDLQDQATLSPDSREGIMAFIEKRAPKFEGR